MDPPHWHLTLRDIGFTGPDDHGAMHAWWLGAHVCARPHPRGGFQVEVHYSDGRSVTLPGGPLLPSDLHPLQVREELWNQLRRIVPAQHLLELAAILRPTVAVATEQALTAMEHGTYRRTIDTGELSRHGSHYRYGTLRSAERTAAEVAAAQSPEPRLVAHLATEHPDPLIRALAVANLACPNDTLLHCAANDRSRPVRVALLKCANPGSEFIERLTVNVLTQGRLDLDLTLDLLLHPLCPSKFQDALMDHAHRATPQFRLQAVDRANTAPPHRRDHLHQELLARPIRRPHTDELLSAVLGHLGPANRERIDWIANHPDNRIRRLAARYGLAGTTAN